MIEQQQNHLIKYAMHQLFPATGMEVLCTSFVSSEESVVKEPVMPQFESFDLMTGKVEEREF